MEHERGIYPTAQQTVDWCSKLDIRLRVINGELRIILPPGLEMPPDLAAAISANEAEIVSLIDPRGGLSVVPIADPETGEVLDDMAGPSGKKKLPLLDAGDLRIPASTDAAWAALAGRNRGKGGPYLFRRRGSLVRHVVDEGAARLDDLNSTRLSHELARAAVWYKPSPGGSVPAVSPPHVLSDMLADPNPRLPKLEHLRAAPYFTPDGRLVMERGYDAASRTLLTFPRDLVIPPVSRRPTGADVMAARALIVAELMGDFPFATQADRANAVALFLLPYARQLIDGNTPNHLIEAPEPGSGKGLLANACLRVAVGGNVPTITQARDDDEWRKRISAVLVQLPVAVLIDNITHTLDSAALAAALTTRLWQDQRLSTNELLEAPVNNVWVTTGNNPTLSREIARRTIRIRLDAGVEQPWKREGFKHPALDAWADEQRGQLLHAALTLIQAWVACGKPIGTATLGSFEKWACVMGGILDTAGVTGFLANRDDLSEYADTEITHWREFVVLWWKEFGDSPVGVKDLYPLTYRVVGFDFGTGTERAQLTSFGTQLAHNHDRVIAGYRITAAGTDHNAKRWRLRPTTDAPPPILPPGTQTQPPLTAQTPEGGMAIPFDESPHADARDGHRFVEVSPAPGASTDEPRPARDPHADYETNLRPEIRLMPSPPFPQSQQGKPQGEAGGGLTSTNLPPLSATVRGAIDAPPPDSRSHRRDERQAVAQWLANMRETNGKAGQPPAEVIAWLEQHGFSYTRDISARTLRGIANELARVEAILALQ